MSTSIYKETQIISQVTNLVRNRRSSRHIELGVQFRECISNVPILYLMISIIEPVNRSVAVNRPKNRDRRNGENRRAAPASSARLRVLGCCSRLKAYVQPDNRNTVATQSRRRGGRRIKGWGESEKDRARDSKGKRSREGEGGGRIISAE